MNHAWQAEFRDPGVAFRGKTFWSWNGKLEKDELLRQLSVIKEMGFGGFFMHSRTGLQTEYLSEEWFSLINACADEAEKMGLEAWLYDEDRWPSGTAGGMVTSNPAYGMKFLHLRVHEAADYVPDPDAVASFCCELDGLDYKNAAVWRADSPPGACAGKQILEFVVRPMNASSFYNGYTYLDTMDREAVNAFIRMTHEKYKSECGPRLGTSIKGIFTDEPHRGPLMEGFSIDMDRPEWNVPWTPLLFDRFRERFGYDLLPRLPALFLRREGETVSQVKWHYVEMLQTLFMENYIQPIQKWCTANRLLLTGHYLHEDSLSAQTAMAGSLMRFYELVDYPGVDVLTEGNQNYWIVKQLSSAARQTGKKWLLSELYGCTGWQFSFENHKSVGDWQALFGINLRCHHLSWYTMEGESKRDYPASIFYQSAWWRDYKFVEDYFARFGAAMSAGRPACDIVVLNPVESVWAQVYPGWSSWLRTASPDIQRIERTYRDMFHWLAGAQLDFDYADEEMLGRLHSLGEEPCGTPCLRIGEARYRIVVVAGMTTMRASTARVLESFIQAGGIVVVAGARPAYIDAVPSKAHRLAGAVEVPLAGDAVVAACQASSSFVIAVTDERTGAAISDLFAQLRIVEDGYLLMLLNVNRASGFSDVRVTLPFAGRLEEWNCSTGSRSLVACETAGEGISFRTSFTPSQEHLFRIETGTMQAKAPDTIVPTKRDAEWVTVNGPFAYRLTEPNVCVLDSVVYRMDGDAPSARMDVLRADIELRDRFGLDRRGGEMIQPWFAAKSEFEPLGTLELTYAFELEMGSEGGIELAIEHPEMFRVSVNGQELALVGDDGDDGWWVDPCFRKFPIRPSLLAIGPNRIALTVDFHEGVNLEAIYLLGSFGVKLEQERPVLTALPERLAAGDVASQGLPFYGAGIVYEIPVPARADRAPSVPLRISLPAFGGAFARVRSVDGTQQTMMAWQPYEADIEAIAGDAGAIELETMLTRRNTFGPLHMVPVLAPAYAPFSFVTEGEAFSSGYALLPSGLLQPPAIQVISPA
ncbi:glycosyl hydrolase [Cohnella rhizosphaerae]|uniref:Glycosyl hydrolase n=1 Tax=Cohnella rhizosphaerae TaxID=1457232 RepID=A0A9X4QWN9_9BACL|nr:glycosyl hydrolase [Cohnella rhizosphaerae]MDG0813854.1 glycosyl hydrolase [Cohnella rhizosphaerae]